MKRFDKDWIFVIGAQRCGTTALVEFLSGANEIQLVTPIRPEPRLLMTAHLDGIEEWERRRRPHATLCEKATSYVEFPALAQLIDQNFASVKVLVLLRDPVQRALSNYYFTRKHGLEQRGLEQALMDSGNAKRSYQTSVNPYLYVERGMYIDYLQPFARRLSPARLYVGVLENLIADIDERSRMLAFLGLSHPRIHNFQRVNEVVREEQVSRAVLDWLSARYAFPNQSLAQAFDVNLSRWQS